jgi:hypothetical protein
MLGLLALKEETSKGAVAPRAEKTYVRKWWLRQHSSSSFATVRKFALQATDVIPMPYFL